MKEYQDKYEKISTKLAEKENTIHKMQYIINECRDRASKDEIKYRDEITQCTIQIYFSK